MCQAWLEAVDPKSLPSRSSEHPTQRQLGRNKTEKGGWGVMGVGIGVFGLPRCC